LLLMFDAKFLRPILVTSIGQLILAYCAVSVIAGYAIMMRIAAVDV
jgi:Flp pilus assembly protein TadB